MKLRHSLPQSFWERINRQNTLKTSILKAKSSDPLLSGECDVLEPLPLTQYMCTPWPFLLQTLTVPALCRQPLQLKLQQNQPWAHPAQLCQFLHSSLAFAGCHISLELPLQPLSTLLKILKRKISLCFTLLQLLIAWFLACFDSYWKENTVIFSSFPSSVWFTILLRTKKAWACSQPAAASHTQHGPAQDSAFNPPQLPSRINIILPVSLPERRGHCIGGEEKMWPNRMEREERQKTNEIFCEDLFLSWR